MPTPPYAKALAQINGGANQSGGIEGVPSAATIQLVPESTVGWTQARWEFVDYPEGWTAPAGWTLDADGVTIYNATVGSPPAFTLPTAASRWGKYALRLRVNEQISSDARIADLLDESLILSMASPVYGLLDLSAKEDQQFTTATTRAKRWVRTMQRNLRLIEAIVGGGGGGSVIFDGDLSGTTTSQVVEKIHGATVPIAGALITGHVLKVSGPSQVTYGAVNLAGGANHVTGVLPEANQADQTLAGDCTGPTGSNTVERIRGTTVTGTPSASGKVLKSISPTEATWQDEASGGGPSGSAGGDLSGTYPNPTVAKINGTTVTGAPGAAGKVLTSTSTTAASWQDPAAGTWIGTLGRLNVSNGSGGPFAPTDIYAGSNWMSWGANPADVGYLRFPYSAGTTHLISVRDASATTRGLAYLIGGSPTTFVLGEYGVFNAELTGVATNVHGSAQVTVSVNGSVKQYTTSLATHAGVPRHGFNSPYASEGELFTTASAPHALTLSEYSQFAAKILNDSSGTYTFPAVASYYQTYIKWVENNGSGTKTISNGGAYSYTLTAGARRLLKFSPEGVFGLDVGDGQPSQGIAAQMNVSNGASGWQLVAIRGVDASLLFGTANGASGFLRMPYSTDGAFLMSIQDNAGTDRCVVHFEGATQGLTFGDYNAFNSTLNGIVSSIQGSSRVDLSAGGAVKVRIDSSTMDVAVPARLGPIGSVFAGVGLLRTAANPGDILAVRKGDNSGNRVVVRTPSESAVQFGSSTDPFTSATLYASDSVVVYAGSSTILGTNSTNHFKCWDVSSGYAFTQIGAPRVGAGTPWASEGEHTFIDAGTPPYIRSSTPDENSRKIWLFPPSTVVNLEWRLTLPRPANPYESYEKTVFVGDDTVVILKNNGMQVTLQGNSGALSGGTSDFPNGCSYTVTVTRNGIFAHGGPI